MPCSRFEPYQVAIAYKKHFHQALQSAIHIADEAVAQSIRSQRSKRCHLLEIYAGDHSPLIEAVRSRAVRFTKSDGDLSTLPGRQGRQRLWSLIDKLQPEHIFVAPECGPWGGWNRLNARKSVKLPDQITSRQDREICRYQATRNRHFHLEQPSGSAMIETPVFAPIRQLTRRAMFDMCAFGIKGSSNS